MTDIHGGGWITGDKEPVVAKNYLKAGISVVSIQYRFTTDAMALLNQSPFGERFIVNVSAMEGQFGRKNKTERHPHTNMAKAALNMLTRTSAADFARDAIYMNSVTGLGSRSRIPARRSANSGPLVIPPVEVAGCAMERREFTPCNYVRSKARRSLEKYRQSAHDW